MVWKGINDNEEHAQALLRFCKIIPSKVNLIEYNPIEAGEFQQADEGALNMYMDILERSGITTRVRKSRGKDIDAACGQLQPVWHRVLKAFGLRSWWWTCSLFARRSPQR